MQRNSHSQQVFADIYKVGQIFHKNKEKARNVVYENGGSYSIASVFMRSENAPKLTINHVLVENGTEQDAFECMLNVLQNLNPKLSPKINKF